MNRADLQRLAEMRLTEARSLLVAGGPSGAYYLAGYAVECGLKSCIAKQVRQFDFPDRRLAQAAHTHDLVELRGLAGLGENVVVMPPSVKPRWLVAKDWSEVSRYEVHSSTVARSLVDAVGDPSDGVLEWLKQHW
jgi:hypothetical protein